MRSINVAITVMTLLAIAVECQLVFYPAFNDGQSDIGLNYSKQHLANFPHLWSVKTTVKRPVGHFHVYYGQSSPGVCGKLMRKESKMDDELQRQSFCAF
jgi:hypothetical protein